MLLDHLILHVNDIDESIQFYTTIMGMQCEGTQDPFVVTSSFARVYNSAGTLGN